jgi:hypothetical protein
MQETKSFFKKIFLLRAGECLNGRRKISKLSKIGKLQIEEIYEKEISSRINKYDTVDIYCPNSISAVESSELIQKLLSDSDIETREFIKDNRLFTDESEECDSIWIKSQLMNSTASVIIIVGHIELVRWFPLELGKGKNYARSGEGVFINNGEVENMLRDEV